MQWHPCLCNLKFFFVSFVYEVLVLLLQFSLWYFFGEGCRLVKDFFICPHKKGNRIFMSSYGIKVYEALNTVVSAVT